MDKLVGQHVTVILEEGSSGLHYAFTGVYGPCDRKERKNLWKELAEVHKTITKPLATGDDFNVITF